MPRQRGTKRYRKTEKKRIKADRDKEKKQKKEKK